MKKIALLSALAPGLSSLGGYATWNSLTSAQKATLEANVINGVCTVTAAGVAVAQVDNAILNPNAASGGSGASAAGTLSKVSAMTAANCAALSGLAVSLSTSGTVTALPAQ